MQPRLDLLDRLATHLESGKLAHKEFDFSTWNDNSSHPNQDYAPNGCGTTGCAIGECPAVFKEWTWRKVLQPEWSATRFAYDPVLKGSRKTSDTMASAKKFFCLTTRYAEALFVPYEWNQFVFSNERPFPGYRKTNLKSGRKAVARNIRAFIKWQLSLRPAQEEKPIPVENLLPAEEILKPEPIAEQQPRRCRVLREKVTIEEQQQR